MKSLPLKAQLYIYLLLIVTLIVSAVSFRSLDTSSSSLLVILICAGAIVIADLYPIRLPFENRVEVTVSCAVKTAAAIVFGPAVTVVVTLLGTLIAEIALRRPWYKAAFNTSEMTLTSTGISLAYEFLYDGARNPFHSLQNAGAVGCMVLVYFLINMGLVATIVSLTTGTSYWHIWKSNLWDLFWNHLTVIPLGAAMAALWQYRPWAVLGLVLPTVLMRQSYQFIADLHRQTRDALIGMADAIDQRDSSTSQHSERVSIIAEAIAKEMDLPFEAVRTIRMAARLHDLGKIGMSNTLLYKPGKFSSKELTEFRKHPAIGAELVRSFRSFTEGQHLILHHHERYDGAGYPMGLSGEAIPLGSRVLAVADSIDAMTSRRVYRPALSVNEAVEELLRCKGTQFAPQVVNAFIRVLDNHEENLPWTREKIASFKQAMRQPGRVIAVANPQD